MPPDADATVLIAGGGIAGLAAAIALRHYGIDSVVFEQADDLRKTQLGSGLHVGYNATRAFDHLGMLDELKPIGAPVKRFEFMTYKGKHLGTTNEVEGELALGVVRPVFHAWLVDAVGADSVQTGAKVERFEQDDSGVTAHFADGRKARGEVLVGADGLRSAIRAQLLGDAEPKYAGYCTRRGIVESDLATDGLHRNFLGTGRRFKSHPVTSTRVYWTASSNEAPGGKEQGAEIKEAVLERFEGWPDPIEQWVKDTDDSQTFFADTVDRDPANRWGEGRVTLLGDAAHPMTWDRGQGACQGIEGAVFLAQRISQARDDPVTALREWEAERIPRTSKLVLASRRSGSLEQSEKAGMRVLRNLLMRLVTKGPIYKRGHANLLVDY